MGFVDNQDRYLNNDSTELIALINRQTELMDKVKQTSDATIDARFLVNASDLALKKSTRLAFGDASAIGIDVDEFVAKCITFMKNGHPLGDSQEEQNSEARRVAYVDEENDDGDALPWHVLGERACFPSNRRPPVPSFLLGPLSVEKRIRATQRTGRQRREAVAAVTKPQAIEAEDLERNDTANLTNQCGKIRDQLDRIIKDGETRIDDEMTEDMEEDEAKALFKRNHLSANYEVSLFDFTVNPRSFGQTVENLFYVSFLIKDGLVTLTMDEDGLPTLRMWFIGH
jgi:hypothetical protein